MAENDGEQNNEENAEENENAEGGKKPKITKKKLIIIIAAVVVLLSAGGAFFLMSGGEPAEESVKTETKDGEESVEQSEENDEKSESADKGKKNKEDKVLTEEEKKKKIDDEFGCTFELKPFHTNLGNTTENRFIRLSVTIEHLCEKPLEEELKKKISKIRDIILAITSKKTREFLLSQDGKIQLRKEMTNTINQHMKKNISGVYITDILIE